MTTGRIVEHRLTKKTRCTACRAKLIDGSMVVSLLSTRGKTIGTYCRREEIPQERVVNV